MSREFAVSLHLLAYTVPGKGLYWGQKQAEGNQPFLRQKEALFMKRLVAILTACLLLAGCAPAAAPSGDSDAAPR